MAAKKTGPSNKGKGSGDKVAPATAKKRASSSTGSKHRKPTKTTLNLDTDSGRLSHVTPDIVKSVTSGAPEPKRPKKTSGRRKGSGRPDTVTPE